MTTKTKAPAFSLDRARQSRFRSKVIALPDGEVVTLHYRVHNVAKVEEYRRLQSEGKLTEDEAIARMAEELAEALYTEEGEPLAEADEIRDWPLDVVLLLAQTVNGVVPEGNASTGEAIVASPTA